jgi:hypothetical protein
MNRLLILIASMCVTGPAVAQQPRDRVRGFTEGSARVAGIVVSDESRPKPVRRMRVTLNGTDLGFRRTVITNDDGGEGRLRHGELRLETSRTRGPHDRAAR